MSVAWAKLDCVITRVNDDVAVHVDETYQTVGILNRGRGLFRRPAISGAATNYPRFYRISAGQLVYSKLFAWEGSIAVVPPEFDGACVSPEFPTFELRHERVLPEYLSHVVGWAGFTERLTASTTGLGQRRQRVNVDDFVEIEIPLPEIDEQRRIAAHLDSVADQAASASAASTLDEKSSTAMLPRVTADLLRAQALPSTQLRDLCSSINRTIHPGDDRGGATEFVGLEHVASHTGLSRGGRPLAEEKGRKLQFKSGEVTYGYLRPYLNKAWVADRTGLCSVEQYVLVPHDGVDSALLGYVLRSVLVLDPAVLATHSLQLPRLRVELLMSFDVPDIRIVADASALLGELNGLRLRIQGLAELSRMRRQLLDGLLPAARNEIFSAMR